MLSNLLSPTEIEKLVENGQPENENEDHNPVVCLKAGKSLWVLSHINHANPSEVYAVYETEDDFGCSFINFEESIASAQGLHVVQRNLEFPTSVYAFDVDFYGSIHLDHQHLSEVWDCMLESE